jgi:hypothetical protein
LPETFDAVRDLRKARITEIGNSRDLRWLLGLSGNAKRQQQSAQNQPKQVSIHCSLLTPYTSPLTPIE